MFPFVGYPGQRKAKVAELSKFGRPVSSHCLPNFHFILDSGVNVLHFLIAFHDIYVSLWQFINYVQLDIRPHDFRMPLVSRLLLPLDLKSGCNDKG